ATTAIYTLSLHDALPISTTCRPPNSTLAEVSEPVAATPSQPSTALKKGKSAPVAAKASPKVACMPEDPVRVASDSIRVMVIRAKRTAYQVLNQRVTSAAGEKPISRPAMMPETSTPVPE